MTQAGGCARRVAMGPLALNQIVKRALESGLSTLMGPLAAILWEPSGQDEQTSQAQSPVALNHIAAILQVCMGNAETAMSNLYQADAQENERMVTQLQSGPKPMLVS